MEQSQFDSLIQTIARLSTEQMNSITVKQTAKGDMYFDVKVHFKSGETDKGFQELRDIYNKIKIFKQEYLGKI
jgi:hypothetical protein